jgi:hypothetical protein
MRSYSSIVPFMKRKKKVREAFIVFIVSIIAVAMGKDADDSLAT